MRRIPKIVPIVILVFATPFILGTEKCEDRDLVSRIIQRIAEQIRELDDRVNVLEECDCEGLLEPVCADTGNTYINACEARCAEVEIASGGLCPIQVCGGDTGEVCDEGSYCETPAGCDATDVGRCMEVPEVCTREVDPVCGCDGNSYRNDCLRMQAGVGLDHPGMCDDMPVECIDNDECDEGDFCNKRVDSCDQMGVCQPRPEACTLEYIPVCGCDGMTYSNACESNANGVTIEHRGACEPLQCGGVDDLMCPDGYACRFTPGECSDMPAGICVMDPVDCPDEDIPVCSCDGTTYANPCAAIKDGAQIESRGECKPAPISCTGDDECNANEFCATKPGMCDEVGICTERPERCTDVVRPVCGCDGMDYENPCLAEAAGTSIASAGRCADMEILCSGPDGETCADGMSCLYKTLGCGEDDMGVCVKRVPADECADVERPVCGCDGVTYANGCVALAEGARVESAGECGPVTPDMP